VRHNRFEQQGLTCAIGYASRREAEVLHACLARSGDAEFVAHADGEDRDRALLGGDLADGVGKASHHPVLLGGDRDAGLQIERGIRPAPSRPRYLGEVENPSVAEMLRDMLAFNAALEGRGSDEEVQYFLTELLPPSVRGAYQPRRNS